MSSPPRRTDDAPASPTSGGLPGDDAPASDGSALPARREEASSVEVRRRADDELLAELREGPSLEEARESLDFWRRRREGLGRGQRRERREADEMIARWETRVRDAERERHGPTWLEQVGLARHLPALRRYGRIGVVVAASLTALAVVLVIAVAVVAVVAWDDVGPVVRDILQMQTQD